MIHLILLNRGLLPGNLLVSLILDPRQGPMVRRFRVISPISVLDNQFGTARRYLVPVAAGRALLFATSRFHHPAHAAEWLDPAIDAAYNDVWQLLMNGLCVAKRRG